MDFRLTTRVSFTPEAKAVFGDKTVGDNRPRRIGLASAVGDLVRFSDCSATFIIAERVWTYDAEFEELQLLLDVADTPGLQSVK